eukprot:s3612_g13.t1
MCTCAWHRSWYSWVGITLLAFYGAGRLGEIILCCREDLLLPRDLLEASKAAFLRLRRFKSLTRQPARVQHMRIAEPLALTLLDRIFGRLDFDAPLFPGSAYQYRLRWNLILTDLSVPVELGLTPGGLRGGSAVFHYRAGRPIADLLWLMRLRSQSTLESYLQEVAALNVLGALSAHSRSSVLAFAATKLEVALDPPVGLHWSNPEEPFPFETELCRGSYFFFHPPTDGRAFRGAAGGLDFAEYFKGKTRPEAKPALACDVCTLASLFRPEQ